MLLKYNVNAGCIHIFGDQGRIFVVEQIVLSILTFCTSFWRLSALLFLVVFIKCVDPSFPRRILLLPAIIYPPIFAPEHTIHPLVVVPAKIVFSLRLLIESYDTITNHNHTAQVSPFLCLFLVNHWLSLKLVVCVREECLRVAVRNFFVPPIWSNFLTKQSVVRDWKSLR